MRGLVVDFGGVLTTSLRDAVAVFADREDVDVAALGAVIASAYAEGAEEGDVAALETGAMPLAEFEEALAVRLRTRNGAPLRAEGLVARLFGNLSIDDGMVAAVRRLHDSGVRTALLTNTWGAEKAMRDEIVDLFDATVLSGEVGMRKPNPEIYALVVERIGLPPGDCVFVDDFEVNVRAAERAGMRGIVHARAEETVRQLQDLFDGQAEVKRG